MGLARPVEQFVADSCNALLESPSLLDRSAVYGRPPLLCIAGSVHASTLTQAFWPPTKHSRTSLVHWPTNPALEHSCSHQPPAVTSMTRPGTPPPRILPSHPHQEHGKLRPQGRRFANAHQTQGHEPPPPKSSRRSALPQPRPFCRPNWLPPPQ